MASPLARWRGFPAPYLASSLRVPGVLQTGGLALLLPLKAHLNRGMGAIIKLLLKIGVTGVIRVTLSLKSLIFKAYENRTRQSGFCAVAV